MFDSGIIPICQDSGERHRYGTKSQGQYASRSLSRLLPEGNEKGLSLSFRLFVGEPDASFGSDFLEVHVRSGWPVNPWMNSILCFLAYKRQVDLSR